MQALKAAPTVVVMQFLPGICEAVHTQTSAGSFVLHTSKACSGIGAHSKPPSSPAIHCR